MNTPDRRIDLAPEDGCWAGRFRAMAGPCEVLVETRDPNEARALTERVAACAWRIEEKFSRYVAGNVVDAINSSEGRSITVDEETANLLDFAATLHFLSDGLFDVTSGVLRRRSRSMPCYRSSAGTRRAGVARSLASCRACRSTSAESARSMRSIRQRGLPPASAAQVHWSTLAVTSPSADRGAPNAPGALASRRPRRRAVRRRRS
jgi:hypothetical protein